MADCLKATCTTNYEHQHGHSCDSNCQAWYGPVVVVDVPKGPRYGTDREH
jgi:hypothetical protein